MPTKNEIRETVLTLDMIFQKLRTLLESGEKLTLAAVPEVVHDDLLNFMVGKTIQLDEMENIVIPKADFKSWIDKIRFKGFDYSLKVKC
jgi:hypothetical protein